MPRTPIEQLLPPEGDLLLRGENSVIVARLRRAIRANDGMYPESFGRIPVDQDNRLLGGNHRTAAARAEGLTTVPTVVHHMENDEARFLFIVKDNAEHGVRWSTADEDRILVVAEKFGISRVQVAEALRIPVTVADRKPIVTVVRVGSKKPVKRMAVPRAAQKAMRGREEVSEQEAEVMASIISPLTPVVHCAELLRMARLDALPVLNLEQYELVRQTAEAIDSWLHREGDLLAASGE